jgi:hypothetical protein
MSERAGRHAANQGKELDARHLWNQPAPISHRAGCGNQNSAGRMRAGSTATDGNTRGHAEPVVPPCFFAKWLSS